MLGRERLYGHCHVSVPGAVNQETGVIEGPVPYLHPWLFLARGPAHHQLPVHLEMMPTVDLVNC